MLLPQKQTNTSASSSPNTERICKQLGETHESTILYPTCSTCNHKTAKLSFFNCCLTPCCQNCISEVHNCEKQGLKENSSEIMECHRCLEHVDQSYRCKECGIESFCKLCMNSLHSKSKYKGHTCTKNLPMAWKSALNCRIHNKVRNILTESSQLICAQCPSKCQKIQILDFSSQEKLPRVKKQIETITLGLKNKQILFRNKWNQLKNQIELQYQKVMHLVSGKYESLIRMFDQMENTEMKTVDKSVLMGKQALKQCEIEQHEFGIGFEVLLARFGILNNELSKNKCQIQNFEQYFYKVSPLDLSKLQETLKGLTISKIKLKQTQDKQNQSLRKSKINQRLSSNNLSVSRRSISKSNSKIETIKNIDLKESIILGSRHGIVHQNKTFGVRNATPTHAQKCGLNSSDKKSVLLKQSSIMSAKIEDIAPVMLNFDMKQSNASRINFLSCKTEKTEEDVSMNENEGKNTKKKSDYFDLRDRMRKSNVINNRFGKR